MQDKTNVEGTWLVVGYACEEGEENPVCDVVEAEASYREHSGTMRTTCQATKGSGNLFPCQPIQVLPRRMPIPGSFLPPQLYNPTTPNSIF